MLLDEMITENTDLTLVYRQPAFHQFPAQERRLRVTALTGGMARVTRTGRDAFFTGNSEIVTGAVPCAYSLTQDDKNLRMSFDGLTVEIGKAKGCLRFYGAGGALLLQEQEKTPCQISEKEVWRNRFSKDGRITESKSVDGVRASAEDFERYLDRTAYECKHNLAFDDSEGLYGLGSHEEGYGNLRGRCRLLYQHNMKAVVPMLVSTKGWGLLYDMSCMMAFHDDADGSYLWADCADELDYYFIGGGDYLSVMRGYRALTGSAPLLPKYAFGYMQSKERYKDAPEMLDVVKEYRRRGVPLDVIVLDWQSWPEGQWGYKVFDPSRFPDPKAFTDALHQLGAKLMISIWPSLQGEDNQNKKDMQRLGYMLGNQTIYDAFLPEARAEYWRQADEGLYSKGVDAWWCDCSEPFESDWHGTIKPEPFERARINTEEAKKYLDPAKINEYSLRHSKGIYEGQRAKNDGKRVCNLTRSSYAGQHRYATITWSGDVSANWETLKRHVPEGINFCAAGEPYWSTDAGGFFPGGFGAWFGQGDYPKGAADLGYRELYVRWLQYGAFLPVMRSHGTGTPREIWRFGEKGEPFYDAIEKAIRLRYALLPYLYALAADCTETGAPILRSPALSFAKDAALRQIDDEMMLGGQLLIKPVTRPMYYLPDSEKMASPDRTESAYLPEGCCWYALDTEARYAGGQAITYDAPLDRIPVFVRAGTVLPTCEVMQYTGEKQNPALTLTIYPGCDGSFTLYDDAGDGYGYEQGECAHVPLCWNDEAGELVIGKREGSYPGMPETRRITVRRVGGQPQTIEYDGEERRIKL